jgi:hypothetical protein
MWENSPSDNDTFNIIYIFFVWVLLWAGRNELHLQENDACGND